MKQNLWLAVVALGLGGSACAAHAAPKAAPAPPAGSADNLGVAGQGVTIFQPDPKAAGKFLFKIYARGISGQSVLACVYGRLDRGHRCAVPERARDGDPGRATGPGRQRAAGRDGFGPGPCDLFGGAGGQ